MTLAAVVIDHMDKSAWILVGMMGVGKSTTGGHLATMSGREHLDTDRMLVRKLGRPIPQLFQLYGEDTFREHETSLLRSLESRPIVLSTGGGIVLREENWTEMRRLGTTIFLDVPIEVLVLRLESSRKRRPLLQGGDIAEKVDSILAARRPLYQKADMTISLESDDAEAAAERIFEAVSKR